jgi:flagellar hook assembly protein FlgD
MLEVFSIKGARVATLVNGYREAGYYHVRWDSRDSRGQAVASGIYFYKISVIKGAYRAMLYRKTMKMILMR